MASKKQNCIALSTSEAEFIAVAQATAQIKWIRQLLSEIGFAQKLPTSLFEDNQSTINMIKNEGALQRTKHVDVKYHFLRHEQASGTISVTFCPSEKKIADI